MVADPEQAKGLLAPSVEAGIELVQELSGISALNVLDRRSLPELRATLKDKLGLIRMRGA